MQATFNSNSSEGEKRPQSSSESLPPPNESVAPGDSGARAAAADQPRLGIVHLMAWTLGSAVILALYRATIDVGDAPEDSQSFWRCVQAVDSVIDGASIGGLMLLAVRRTRGGPPFPVAPGHWILVLAGLLTVVSWSLYSAIRLLSGSERSLPDYGWYAYYCAGVMAVSVLANLGVYLFAGQGSWWRTYFGIAALLAGVQFLAWWRDASVFNYYTIILSSGWYDMGDDVRRFSSAAGVALLLLMLRNDWRRGVRRDWLHWTGAAVVLCNAAVHWSWTVWAAIAGA